MLQNARSCPGIPFLTIPFPFSRACLGIEHLDRRLTLVIPNDDKFPIMQHGGATFTKTGSYVGSAKITLPQFLTIQVILEG